MNEKTKLHNPFLVNIPSSFEDFLVDVESWLKTQKGEFKNFLWLDYEINIVIEEFKTFAFLTSEKKVIIPLNFLRIFYKKILAWKFGSDKWKYNFSFVFLKFWIFHELSHFRDLIFEKKDKKAMIKILTEMSEVKLKYWKDKVIPIWALLHNLANWIDDIIVNTEVEMDIWVGMSREDLNWFYKYNLFADTTKKEWWEYLWTPDWLDYVWEWNGDCEINDWDTIDYSKGSFSQAFSDYFLRSFMVTDQKIILPQVIENILFWDNERKTRKSVFRSIKEMITIMTSYYQELEKNSEYSQRCKDLKSEYIKLIEWLKDILVNKKEIEELLKNAIKSTNSQNKIISSTIDLITLVRLLTLSTWKQKENHILDICPSDRYQLYRKIFLPLQKWFILMDLLKEDIKDGNSKSTSEWEWKWEWTWEWKWEWTWVWKSTWEWQIHHSPDIEEKIRILEELDKQDEEREAQKLIKKILQKSKFDISSILESSWISQAAIDITRKIISEHENEIRELVEFFISQLYRIEKVEKTEVFSSRKWKLNVGRVIDYIAWDPSCSKLHEQKIYDRKLIIEEVSKKFKKIDLTLVIDISWSTDQFKWKNGMINIISTILYVAMKHLEQHLKNLLDDPDFEIPVNYILYWDWAPFSSIESGINTSSDEVRIAELNQYIISLTWWTNDTTAWDMVSKKFDDVLINDPVYVEQLRKGERKSCVVQVADTDVSENWVEYLIKVFSDHINDPILVNTLPIRRIILWVEELHTFSKEEYEEMKKEWKVWNWEPTTLPDGRIQLKQIWIKRKSEILWQIKALFENFFVDINY